MNPSPGDVVSDVEAGMSGSETEQNDDDDDVI
jgi:hypothetical protein